MSFLGYLARMGISIPFCTPAIQEKDPPTLKPVLGWGFSCGEDSWMLTWAQENWEADDYRNHLVRHFFICWRQHTLLPGCGGEDVRADICLAAGTCLDGGTFCMVPSACCS